MTPRWLFQQNVTTRECELCGRMITFSTLYMTSRVPVHTDTVRAEVSHVNEYGEMSVDRNFVVVAPGITDTQARHLVWNAMVTGLNRVLSGTGCG